MRIVALISLVVCVACGCADTREPMPSADHPANPRAAEAPAPRASTAFDASPTTAPGSADALAPPVAYTCPHHPKVMEAEPGECPYCGMALVPTTSRQTSPLRGVSKPAEPKR